MIRTLDYPELSLLDGGGFSLLSPAKINLGLKVVGKRPDGFHELDTVFQEIDLCDRIEFYPADHWLLEIHGSDLDVEDNLIVKAARLLSEFTGIPCHARIVLHKRIPLCGGLGGGSSNAAITLHGLSKLWELNISWRTLQEIASETGSDCPFFIYGGRARGRGRGEKLELYDGSPGGEVVVVNPGFGISTSWVFSECHFPLTEPNKNVIFIGYVGGTQGAYTPLELPFNSLENKILGKYSDLRAIRDELLQAGAHVSLLSGSGSSVFGIFGERSKAKHAAQQLSDRYTAHICRMIGRQRISEEC